MKEILLQRGEFLGADLRAMFNNPVYSDIIITCKDGGVVYGSKLLLAARSDVFARLLIKDNAKLNDKENNNNSSSLSLNKLNFDNSENNLTFTEFNSEILLIILEYLYMGNITMESLTLTNVVEGYLGAEYFLLPGLEEIIITFLDNALKCSADNNLSAKILTHASEFMLPSSDDTLFRTLHNCLVVTPLESIDYDNLTAEGLTFILSPLNTNTSYEEFVTSEYGIFRYIILWSAYHCEQNNDSILSYFEPLLPSSDHAECLDVGELEQLRKLHEKNSKKSKSKEIKSSITATLNTLLPCVDFKLIHPSVLANIIEPLDIVPNDMLIDAFRYQAQLPAGSGPKRNRGTITAKPENLRLQWSQQACGKQCMLSENDILLKSSSKKYEWARTTLPIRGYEIYEWDIFIEETCKHLWIGVCTERKFKVDYSTWLGGNVYGWVLGSNGSLYHNDQSSLREYGMEFGKGDRITVHLNMGNRSLAYSINGIRYGEAWNTLPPELYPAVSLKKPAKVRIEIHKKPIIIENNNYLMPYCNHSNIPNIQNIQNVRNNLIRPISLDSLNSLNTPYNTPNNQNTPNTSNTPIISTSDSTSQISAE
ncbi:16650_t:CDS:1 [Funneliformis geosporum]|uniref:15355_t:CDS:1 n=1 Tax=Funneliformis geosporum TaxID=1117311 RepID=A0A9W4SDZ4_9GLOM|nr:15355_t:CDS:1 [Funneliformis geosporum]CAI2174400.1 16650_t:CDS:1 [Funneliformis geosporum]